LQFYYQKTNEFYQQGANTLKIIMLMYSQKLNISTGLIKVTYNKPV